MKVQDIYKQVRWCFDEEALNGSLLASAVSGSDDNTLMNNIIKSKIGDALRWVCLYAPSNQLSGVSSPISGSIGIVVDETNQTPDSSGRFSMGEGFIRLVRIRGTNWHRAIMGDSLLREDSDEYLQLMDGYGATATADRPQAALIDTAIKSIEVHPHTGTFDITKIVIPSASAIAGLTANSEIDIPPILLSSFIYYLAFLTLSAYGDGRAQTMLSIAKINLGLEDKQN